MLDCYATIDFLSPQERIPRSNKSPPAIERGIPANMPLRLSIKSSKTAPESSTTNEMRWRGHDRASYFSTEPRARTNRQNYASVMQLVEDIDRNATANTSMDTGARKSSMETSQATREHYIHVDRQMTMIFSNHLMQATSELMKKMWYTLSRGSAILVA